MMHWSSGDAPIPFCSMTCYEIWALAQPSVGESGELNEGV